MISSSSLCPLSSLNPVIYDSTMPPSRSFMEDADSFLDETFMADDGEISRVLQETEARQTSTDTKVLQKSLRNAHIALSKAQAENLEIRRRFMELKATVIHLAATKRQERRSKKANDEDDEDDVDDFIPEDIKELAKYLRAASKKVATLFVNFWSNNTPASLTANPMPPFEWDNAPRRFASRDAMAPFCTLLYQFASKHRSNTSNRLRNAAAAIFGPSLTPLFDAKRQALSQVVFTTDDPWIGKGQSVSYPRPYPIRDPWIYPLKTSSYTPKSDWVRPHQSCHRVIQKARRTAKWPGILYEDGEYDPGKEFRNPLLFRVARVKIYGPSAVDGERSACRIRDGSPMAGEELESTIGLMANTACETCWLLSADTELNNNAISLHSSSLQEQNPAAMKALLDLWDENVFPNYAGSHSANARSATTIDNSVDNPSCPVLTDLEHFAQMQAAMARAQIVDPVQRSLSVLSACIRRRMCVHPVRRRPPSSPTSCSSFSLPRDIPVPQHDSILPLDRLPTPLPPPPSSVSYYAGSGSWAVYRNRRRRIRMSVRSESGSMRKRDVGRRITDCNCIADDLDELAEEGVGGSIVIVYLSVPPAPFVNVEAEVEVDW
ncbi:hypothetical protein NMY22_g19404 [Coprinellus aureogranulatus]|nr:hypothetical protein NMY22_g19404 [Coprinellus aureogranulatus]